MSDPSPTAPARRSRAGSLLLVLLVLLALGAGGWYAWTHWQARQDRLLALAEQQRNALDARVEALRQGQRAQAQRLQQAEATNRVLRDEVLGVGQRAALLEDSVSKLADPDRHGAQALLLDETALLLAIGQQRLQLAGDADAARRAYALAANLLERVDDPRLLDLGQALVQERAALDALGPDPRTTALRGLAVFSAALPAAGDALAPGDAHAPGWQKLLSRVVRVQPSSGAIATDPGERADARSGLELEITLARAAAERRDTVSWREALDRAGAWLRRLWPQSPQRHALETRLARLRAAPLAPSVPVLGSTLQQLQALRATR